MKNFFVILLSVVAVAFVSCKDDKTGTDDGQWFAQPQTTAVTGTTAEVICQTGFADGVLATSSVGFTYAPVDDQGGLGAFVDASSYTVDGNLLRTRLSGLTPRTTYQVYAFMDMGSSRVLSPAAAFTTLELAPDETVLEITSLTTLPVVADEGVYTITYELINPVEGAYVEAACTEGWVHSFDNSVKGEITFDVDKNPGAERSAVVTLTYPKAEPQRVTVVQRAAETTPPQPEAVEIQLGAQDSGWPASYTKTTAQVGDYYYALSDVAVFGGSDRIQFKRGTGSFANAEDKGPIRRIEVVYADGSDKNLSLFLGDQTQPDGSALDAQAVSGPSNVRVDPAITGQTCVFDCTDYDFRYFTLSNGSGVSYVSSVTIVCGGSSDKPEPEAKPTFAAPAYVSLTKNSATILCDFAYTGTKTVSEVYFLYTGPTGGDQRAAVASTQPGTKSASLTGLNPSTRYTFRLCVVIEGELYTSQAGAFTTYDESGKPNVTTRYSGWPELVSEDVTKANSEYYYAYHICPDFKVQGNLARNYTVCFSAKHHCPVWVAAPRHKCYEKGSGRTNAYGKDPDIPANIQYNSKSIGGGCNKGHMLGSHERETTTKVNRQVFYYTNIAPQYSSGYNTGGGGWNTLEDWIDGKVCSDTTYLVIGTYFESYTDGYGVSASPKKIQFGGRSDVSCPTMFYIAALRTKKGNTGKSVLNCTKDELMCVAFVRAHSNELKEQKVSSKEMMSIADLERLTGHTFFANVPDAPKNSYNPTDWGL